MTTYITELAHSLKAAIKEATPGEWYVDYDFDVCTEGCGFIAETHGNNLVHNAQFIALANPQNVLALVEAQEKAQRYIEELREWNAGLAQESFERQQRIAELESRTVKLPDDEDGQAYGFGKWANGKLPATAGTMTIAYCEDAWRAAFEVFSSTAGIKVEAE
ncbi:TPA: ead/Ea22-like family protein [Klebsiella michiganensis]|nr:ead/Ea22-like family protein [Klebsiella michiganensis]